MSLNELLALEDWDFLVKQSVLVETRKAAVIFPAKNRAIVEALCSDVSELAKELEALQEGEEVRAQLLIYSL